MNILFEVTKVICDGVTENNILTSNVEDVIKMCKLIRGDYNITVWINGKFDDLYTDPGEDEIREIYSQILLNQTFQ